MKYWQGYMDWPLDKDWKCETCGEQSLIWGLVHAQCRCTNCHTQYRMRDDEDKVVNVPICQLKPEYKEPAKRAYSKYKLPIDKLSDEQWYNTFAEVNNGQNS